MKKVKKNSKQFSILDFRFLIAAVLFAIMLVLAWVFSGTDKKFVQAGEELFALSNKVRVYYSNRPDYWGLNTQKVLSDKILDDSLAKDAKIIGVLGNEIIIGQGIEGNVTMPRVKSFDVVYKNLSKTQCRALAAMKMDEKQALGLLSVTINNGLEAKVFAWGIDTNPLPVSYSNAKKLCNDNSDIIWKFE